ncbi:MAG: hypothetical protein IJI57_04630 [Flexilinea sp.]|nr:hypothetical protein [Flexilinea sp.]
MTGNFDYNTTIADMNSIADLPPFWEAAEAKQISDGIALAEWLYFDADNQLSTAPEWYLERHSAELWAQLEEAKAVLAGYGIEASLLV